MTLPSPALAQAQLRVINHRFVNAIAVADGGFIDALTAADFLLTSITGDWIDRTRFVELMRRPAVHGVSYDDVRVRLFGPLAVVHGVFEALGEQGTAVRVRYTDVYRWDGAGWRLVHAQNTVLQDGVAKQQHQGRSPVLASWQGADPLGTDDEVLRDLNADYVAAFRAADVVWYDAHLTHDYVVVNSDGSFHDRARALNEFAKPSYALTMRSFPVDQVCIRRFGDIALIHAENAYERKDGRKGINRYTDIWHRQEDGRWMCIAAHITAYKAPG